MTGDVGDRRFVLDPFEGEDGFGPMGVGDFDDGGEEDGAAAGVGDLRIGDPGLAAGHRFLFRYDFGTPEPAPT